MKLHLRSLHDIPRKTNPRILKKAFRCQSNAFGCGMAPAVVLPSQAGSPPSGSSRPLRGSQDGPVGLLGHDSPRPVWATAPRTPASGAPTYQIANGTATIEPAAHRATWGTRLAVHCTQRKKKEHENLSKKIKEMREKKS